jgi:hypothetical protein
MDLVDQKERIPVRDDLPDRDRVERQYERHDVLP